MLLQVPVCTAGSQPMRRQDRGDVGDDLSSRMQELRMDASSKGIAWLQKKVDSMGRDDLRKMAAAVVLSTRGPGGAMVPVAELRKAVVEHFAPQASLLGGRCWVRRGLRVSCKQFLWVASQKVLVWIQCHGVL